MCQESCGARIPYVWQAVPQEEETLSIPDLASHTPPFLSFSPLPMCHSCDRVNLADCVRCVFMAMLASR